MSNENLVKFVPFSSCVDPSFWHKLAQLKLDVDRLDEPIHHLWGYFSSSAPRGLNQILSVDCSSFNQNPDNNGVVAVGRILNKNTIDSFKQVDKAQFLAEEGKHLMKVIAEDALDNPLLLSRFTVLCFADLKKHKFTYWFAFPAVNAVTCRLDLAPSWVEEQFSPEQQDQLSGLDRKRNYWVLKAVGAGFESYDVKEGFDRMKDEPGQWFLAFADSTNDVSHPGWPLRNFLALFAYHCPTLLSMPVSVIALRWTRLGNGQWSVGKSLILAINLSVTDGAWEKAECCVGWERNEKGKFGPRQADLHASMNPLTLAESSVDLNLKLMKWQVMPDLDLDVIKTTRCVLLGAGTLGCVVARSLLGWGVRHITIVDNAAVSYSNPVRQSLYQFSDVGKPKAPVAAAALKAIFPAVVSEGIELSIPMPGHPVGESLLQATKDSVTKLDELIRTHDAIFLLMDSRESRWLPTVIGAAHKKIVMNAALGFDSYLVMRHGLKSDEPTPRDESSPHTIPGDHLGCYFCSDVTAPGNSGQARTLDQQCTVTRPGVSNIAGSLAVELLVSLLQHQDRGRAPAFTKPRDTSDCRLGIIPHSIRGFLSRFQTMLPAIEAFSCCVGCSTKVVNEYRSRGFDFVFQVLDSKKYLEDLTGLTDLNKDSILDDVLELSSDESEAN